MVCNGDLMLLLFVMLAMFIAESIQHGSGVLSDCKVWEKPHEKKQTCAGVGIAARKKQPACILSLLSQSQCTCPIRVTYCGLLGGSVV